MAATNDRRSIASDFTSKINRLRFAYPPKSMNWFLKIGKHSLSIGCILITWAFLCILPVRYDGLTEALPFLFYSPADGDKIRICLLVGLTPLAVLCLPLYILHSFYEGWEKKQLKKEVEEFAKEVKRRNSKRS